MAGSRYGTGRYGVGIYGLASGNVVPTAVRGTVVNATSRAGVSLILGAGATGPANTSGGYASARKIMQMSVAAINMTIAQAQAASTLSMVGALRAESTSGGYATPTGTVGLSVAPVALTSAGRAGVSLTLGASGYSASVSGGYSFPQDPFGSAAEIALRGSYTSGGRASARMVYRPAGRIEAVSGGDAVPLRRFNPLAVSANSTTGRASAKRIAYAVINSTNVTHGSARSSAKLAANLSPVVLGSGGHAILRDLWEPVDIGSTVWKQVGIN